MTSAVSPALASLASPMPLRTSSPRPIPRYPTPSQIYSPYRPNPAPVSDTTNPFMPRSAHILLPARACSLPHSTPESSRSPSVCSWRSCETEYDADGLIIEEVDSDDENLPDSDVEVLVGEYEDPPSDDDEYWERRKYQRELDDTHNMVVNGFEELSTSVSSPICAFFSNQRMCYPPPTSPVPVAGSKRGHTESASDDEDTDQDASSLFGRRTRRRVSGRDVPRYDFGGTVPTQVTRGFNVGLVRESSAMEE